MRAVLDEGVPRQLIPLLQKAGCRVQRFPKDWKGLKNGQLLDRLVSDGFECLVTCDKSFRYQQNLKAFRVAIVVLPGQRLAELTQRVPEIVGAIFEARIGFAVEIPRIM